MRNLLVLIGGVFLMASAKVQAQVEIFRPEILDNAGQVVQFYVDGNQIAGGVALVAHQGNVIYHKAFGLQNIESKTEMKTNSLFQIASMTKPITTVALLMLMEEGKVKVDDPITKYLPKYERLQVRQSDGSLVSTNQPLMIKHFLTHTTGLPNGGDPLFAERVNMSKINSLEQYVDAFSELPLLHQPEEKFTYAVNTNVIARVVEIIGGKPFEDFIQERIFEPLGMNSTYFFIPNSDLNRFSSLYKSTGEGLKLVQGPTTRPVKFPMGNGGLTSTAGDYFRFAQMLLNGGELDGKRILKKETVDMMTANQLPRKLVPLNIMNTVLPETGFGLGVAVIEKQSSWTPAELKFSNMGNLPSGSFYWPGIANTYWWADPSNQVVGVLLTQSTDPSRTTIFQEFHQALYNSLYMSPALVDGSAIVSTGINDEEREFLVNHLKKNKVELEALVQGLSKKQLDFKFDPNRWSIKECLEHIAVTETSLWEWAIAGMNEPANPARRSEVRANETMIIARLSDRVNKLDAPQEARPTGRYKKAKEAMRDYKQKRIATIQFVETTQDDLRNHFVVHHVAGTIDVYMALVLLSAHQSRHNMQIKEIMGADAFPKR